MSQLRLAIAAGAVQDQIDFRDSPRPPARGA